MKFILARKVNMTQIFTEDGKVFPVTVLSAGPCKVTQIKTAEKDGYSAVQIAQGNEKAEFKVQGEMPVTGAEVKVSDFEPGEMVNIWGVSKGRGFAGAVKRHGFHGAPASHGHDHPRAVGSIGNRFPQHTRPGMRMAGHMGARGATVLNSVVVSVDPEKNLIYVKGGVPGHPTSLLRLYTTGKKKNMPGVMKYGEKIAQAPAEGDDGIATENADTGTGESHAN